MAQKWFTVAQKGVMRPKKVSVASRGYCGQKEDFGEKRLLWPKRVYCGQKGTVAQKGRTVAHKELRGLKGYCAKRVESKCFE